MERGNTTREAREFLTRVGLQTEGLCTTSELMEVPAAKHGPEESTITMQSHSDWKTSTEEEESGRGSFVF